VIGSPPPRARHAATAVALAVGVAMAVPTQAEMPRFAVHTISSDMPGAYCVRAADVDGDGRTDVIAQGREVVWFRNPDWQRFPLTSTTRGNIFVAPRDLDGDGLIEIALASDFGLRDSRAGGTLSVLHRGADLNEEWTVERIGAEPTAHRLFWGELDGDPAPELLVAPILGPGAEGPVFDQAGVHLWVYEPPAEAGGEWSRTRVDDSLPVVHAAELLDFDDDGRDEILATSYEGVHIFETVGDGAAARWQGRHLLPGYQDEPAPRRGSSEVGLGRVGSTRFLATAEPWHGHQVVVYTAEGGAWSRRVIDDSLDGAHALAVADLDGDGDDEIVAGYRGEGTSLLAYEAADSTGTRWTRHVIDDGGIAAQRCEAVDLDGDGDLDLVASGGSTSNVRWYENRG
jgi:hypothetical protein